MFGIGTGEILLILLIATLVVGPEEVVSFARDMGQLFAKLRQETDSVTEEFRQVLSEGPEGEEATRKVQAGSTAAIAEAAESAEAPIATQEEAIPAETEKEEVVEDQEEEPEELSASPSRAFIDGEMDAFGSLEETGDGADAKPVLIVVGEPVPKDEDVEPIVIEAPVLVENDVEAGEG